MSCFLFGFIYTYILFPDTAEKQSDASMWGINYLIWSISAISWRSAHIYHPSNRTCAYHGVRNFIFSEHFARFSGVFKVYKMGTLPRNGLIKFSARQIICKAVVEALPSSDIKARSTHWICALVSDVNAEAAIRGVL